MPALLLIETTGQSCSVALTSGNSILAKLENTEGLSHATLLTVFIEEIFQDQKINGKALDAVVVSMGPGSYTGIRIGVAAAKGICYASGKPLIAINTLQAMSWGMQAFLQQSNDPLVSDPGLLYCPMVDARRMEVYCSLLNQQHKFAEDIRAVILHQELFADRLRDHKIVFFGSGSEKAKTVITGDNGRFIPGFLNSASHLLNPALQAFSESRFEDTAYFEPFYLKDFVATIPKKNIISQNLGN